MLLVVLGSLFVADFLVTAIGLIGLNRKLKNLEYVTSKLRQGSNKLGEDLFQGAVALYDKQQESKQVLLTKGLAGKRALQKDWQREAARLKVKYEENIRNNWLRRRLQQAQRGRPGRLRDAPGPRGGAALCLWAVLLQAVLDFHGGQRGRLCAGDALCPGAHP